jgi:type II secretory pathway component GspD/PulD (secretin)
VVIVPEMVGNGLVIGGEAGAVEEVRRLVAELDHASVMVCLEVVVGEVPLGKTAGSAAAGQPGAEKTEPQQTPATPAQVEDLRRQMETMVVAQLTTLSNQRARVQIGRREPRITGTNMSQQRRFHTIQLELHFLRNAFC